MMDQREKVKKNMRRWRGGANTDAWEAVAREVGRVKAGLVRWAAKQGPNAPSHPLA